MAGYEVSDTQPSSTGEPSEYTEYNECSHCDTMCRVTLCLSCKKAYSCEGCRIFLRFPPGSCQDCNTENENLHTQVYSKEEDMETQVYAKDEDMETQRYSKDELEESPEENTQMYGRSEIEESDIPMDAKEESYIDKYEEYEDHAQQESIEDESLTPLDEDIEMEETNEIHKQLINEKDKEIAELKRKVFSLYCERIVFGQLTLPFF